jgi:hypothetical protein
VYIDLDFQIPICSHFKIHLPWYFFFIFHFSLFLYYTISFLIRDQPFNLKGGVYGFLFRSENIYPTTQELGYFFLSARREFFFQNLTLTKTLNQIIFFSSTKIRIFFSATLGIRIFFLEKNHNLPPLLPWNRQTWSRHLQ